MSRKRSDNNLPRPSRMRPHGEPVGRCDHSSVGFADTFSRKEEKGPFD